MPRAQASAVARPRRKRKIVNYNEDSSSFGEETTTVKTEQQEGLTAEKSSSKKKKQKQTVKKEPPRSSSSSSSSRSRSNGSGTDNGDDVDELIKEMLLKPCTTEVKRNKDGALCFADRPDFRPNLAPYQVLQLGSFGGTYFRPIKSSVTDVKYRKEYREFPKKWFEGLTQDHITRPWDQYSKATNYFGVKCGGDLDMWEGKGWISALDPYGWFQWYCRFFRGRRSKDDTRQIKRWAGVCSKKGRFRNQLIGKCARANTSYDDDEISPVIRQTLLHWGYLLQEKDAKAYVKLKGLPQLQPSARNPVDVAKDGVPESMKGTLPRKK